jgi:AcrR family transcriptional regulator
VLRSRSTLLAATVRLVSERRSTAIAVTDLADAANVSRQLVYLQFGDRDALLVAAAVDLVQRELVPQLEGGSDAGSSRALAAARHFAQYRPFYRALLTGSCAFAMTRTLNGLFSSFNRHAVRTLFGELDQGTAEDLTTLFTGGMAAVINDWLIDGADPLDPEELTRRLLRLIAVLAGSRPAPRSRAASRSRKRRSARRP